MFTQDYIAYLETPTGFFVGCGIALTLIAIVVAIYFGKKSVAGQFNNGGHGGSVSVTGDNATAIGGKGGGGGPGGRGGDGGDGDVVGDNAFVMGGEGGEAGQIDRGGKGGRGPLHVLMEDYPEKYKEISNKFGFTEEAAKRIGGSGDGSLPPH